MDAPELPNEAHVVRGGVMESTTMLTNAVDHSIDHPGQWAISVASAAEWSVKEIALAAPFPHRQIRVSTVGEIRGLGHDVVPSGKVPHADLRLATEPTEEVWEALRSVFGKPQPNPKYGQEV